MKDLCNRCQRTIARRWRIVRTIFTLLLSGMGCLELLAVLILGKHSEIIPATVLLGAAAYLCWNNHESEWGESE